MTAHQHPLSPYPIETLTAPITSLKENEVFVFGTNEEGFHGAGSAGMAMRGDARNTWRSDPHFLKAKSARPGSPERTGKWAVYGMAEGPMEGHEGKSYGVITIKRPGDRRSVPLDVLEERFVGLLQYAQQNPHLTFIITPLAEGYSGYHFNETRPVWERALGKFPKLCNLRFVRMQVDTVDFT